MSYIIYTDGGCSGNPGPGGWACIILGEGESHEFSGGEKETTNNRMELMAVISSFEKLKTLIEDSNSLSVEVFTDSQYVKNGITSWIKKWSRNGWLTSGKKPVKNKDLWQKLLKLTVEHKVTWNWVKAHSGDEYNERCDYLVRKVIKSLQC